MRFTMPAETFLGIALSVLSFTGIPAAAFAGGAGVPYPTEVVGPADTPYMDPCTASGKGDLSVAWNSFVVEAPHHPDMGVHSIQQQIPVVLLVGEST